MGAKGRRHLAVTPPADAQAMRHAVSADELRFVCVGGPGNALRKSFTLSGCEVLAGSPIDYFSIRVCIQGEEVPWEEFRAPPTEIVMSDGIQTRLSYNL